MSSATAADQAQENQWKPIGAAVEETVGAGDVPVEVIESLCMQCYEQVRIRVVLDFERELT